MKSEVFLIRHGETEENRSRIIQGQISSRLSEKGRKQADMIAQHLSGIPIAAIYSSDLLRAADTARIIAEALSMSPIRYDLRLRERAFGIYEGKPLFTLLRALAKAGNNLKTFVPENGEPYQAVLNRTGDFLYDMGKHYAGVTVLAITHHTVIEAAIDIYRKDLFSGTRLDNCDGIVLQLSRNAILDVKEITHNESL